jgi:hypothetical protein
VARDPEGRLVRLTADHPVARALAALPDAVNALKRIGELAAEALDCPAKIGPALLQVIRELSEVQGV